MKWAVVALVLVLAAGCVAPEEADGPEGTPSPAPAPPTSGEATAPAIQIDPGTVAWRGLSDAPAGRTEIHAASWDGIIYVLGGFTGSVVPTPSMLAFDPAAGTWTETAPYPLPIHHTAMVAHDGMVYVFGGYHTIPFQASPFAARFDIASGAWEVLPQMPQPRGAHGAALIDGRVYLVGGVGSDGSLLAATDVYDIAAGTWSEADALGTPREHLAVGALETPNGTRIIAAGGRSSDLTTNQAVTEIYDPATDRWSAGRGMPSERGGVAGEAFDGPDGPRFVVLGGEHPGGTFFEAEAYDPVADVWEAYPDMPTARHGLGAARVGDELFALMGGPEPNLSVGVAVEALGVTS